MIAETSLDAYLFMVAEHRTNRNETIILDVFRLMVKGQPLSNLDILNILNSQPFITRDNEWHINQITGRVNSLVKKGKLVCVGMKRQLETGRRVQLWGLPEDNMQWIDFDYKEGRVI